MLQVIQNYKTGELKVDDVPVPATPERGVLVQNHYSLISAGTEKTTVGTAQKNLAGKAKSRPDLVKQVMDHARREGFYETYKLVKNKLDSSVPLGYSSAGIVLESSSDDFSVGDRVACGGQGYASHAEIVAVPQNLAVRVPDGVSLEHAAFTTIGSIAVQGVRQAAINFGETVCVIGLGLVGQLTVQILRAAGCRVVGVDVDEEAINLARTLGCDLALSREEGVEKRILDFTKGRNADAVIITASGNTNDPIELAGAIARDRGTVVIVGGVKADIPRSPYYEKELDVRLSRSYGPGRYDVSYEEKGQDYPIGFVRWTVRRNMESFLDLIADNKISLQPIITHRFRVEDAKKAYDLIVGNGKVPERFVGILLEYSKEGVDPGTLDKKIITGGPTVAAADSANIGFLGAGKFAQSFLLPVLKKTAQTQLIGVSNARGASAKNVARKFKFGFATADNQEILDNEDINCLFIATRHNLHAKYVIEGLKRQKSVFVEKPLAITYEELEQVKSAYTEHGGRLMVGFNRRFSPAVQETRKFFKNKLHPYIVNYRVNAGFIPKEHWIQDPSEGGGRIIGEVCHFVDLISYLIDSRPVRVFAESFAGDREDFTNRDNVNITLRFRDGSIGTISYNAVGDKSYSKERIEIFGENSVAAIDDFRSVTLTRAGKTGKAGGSAQDKGYRAEIREFVKSVTDGAPSPIPFEDSYIVTLTTFKILESLSKGLPVELP